MWHGWTQVRKMRRQWNYDSARFLELEMQIFIDFIFTDEEKKEFDGLPAEQKMWFLREFKDPIIFHQGHLWYRPHPIAAACILIRDVNRADMQRRPAAR